MSDNETGWGIRSVMKERTRWLSLVLFILICLGAGGLGAIATTPEIDGWYRTIIKPEWNPPNWVFGPVWTTLFVLMGISAWLVWKPAGFRAADNHRRAELGGRFKEITRTST